MNQDVDEVTDDDADKIIGEIEMKVGGGSGGGVINYLRKKFIFSTFFLLFSSK